MNSTINNTCTISNDVIAERWMDGVYGAIEDAKQALHSWLMKMNPAAMDQDCTAIEMNYEAYREEVLFPLYELLEDSFLHKVCNSYDGGRRLSSHFNKWTSSFAGGLSHPRPILLKIATRLQNGYYHYVDYL